MRFFDSPTRLHHAACRHVAEKGLVRGVVDGNLRGTLSRRGDETTADVIDAGVQKRRQCRYGGGGKPANMRARHATSYRAQTEKTLHFRGGGEGGKLSKGGGLRTTHVHWNNALPLLWTFECVQYVQYVQYVLLFVCWSRIALANTKLRTQALQTDKQKQQID